MFISKHTAFLFSQFPTYWNKNTHKQTKTSPPPPPKKEKEEECKCNIIKDNQEGKKREKSVDQFSPTWTEKISTANPKSGNLWGTILQAPNAQKQLQYDKDTLIHQPRNEATRPKPLQATDAGAVSLSYRLRDRGSSVLQWRKRSGPKSEDDQVVTGVVHRYTLHGVVISDGLQIY